MLRQNAYQSNQPSDSPNPLRNLPSLPTWRPEEPRALHECFGVQDFLEGRVAQRLTGQSGRQSAGCAAALVIEARAWEQTSASAMVKASGL